MKAEALISETYIWPRPGDRTKLDTTQQNHPTGFSEFRLSRGKKKIQFFSSDTNWGFLCLQLSKVSLSQTQHSGFNCLPKHSNHDKKFRAVRPRDTRPWAARTSQVHVFELVPKKLEMNEFMKWKPRAARFSDHLAFTLLSNKSCTNFELHEFFLSPKNVHLKALLYLFYRKNIQKILILIWFFLLKIGCRHTLNCGLLCWRYLTTRFMYKDFGWVEKTTNDCFVRFSKRDSDRNPLFLLWQQYLLSAMAIFHIVMMANVAICKNYKCWNHKILLKNTSFRMSITFAILHSNFFP